MNEELSLQELPAPPPGKAVSVKWKDGPCEGPVLERSVYADNPEGKRESKMEIGCGNEGSHNPGHQSHGYFSSSRMLTFVSSLTITSVFLS